jgi:hypothetical protein
MGRAIRIIFGVLCFGIGVSFAVGALDALLHPGDFDNSTDAAFPAILGSMFLLGSFFLLADLARHDDNGVSVTRHPVGTSPHSTMRRRRYLSADLFQLPRWITCRPLLWWHSGLRPRLISQYHRSNDTSSCVLTERLPYAPFGQRRLPSWYSPRRAIFWPRRGPVEGEGLVCRQRRDGFCHFHLRDWRRDVDIPVDHERARAITITVEAGRVTTTPA